MGKVHELIPIDRRELVEGLENLLAEARAGTISAIAYVTQPTNPEDPVTTGLVSGDDDGVDVPQITFAMQGLLHRLYAHEFLDREDDD